MMEQHPAFGGSNSVLYISVCAIRVSLYFMINYVQIDKSPLIGAFVLSAQSGTGQYHEGIFYVSPSSWHRSEIACGILHSMIAV